MNFNWLMKSVLLLGIIFNYQVSFAQDRAKTDKNQIVDMVQSYVDAFNKRDAALVSEHWATNGEFIDDQGTMVKGRKNIRQALAKQFEEMDEELALSVTIDRITFVNDNVAIEEGIADVSGGKSKYTAIHKREGGKWRLHSIRESDVEDETPAPNRLAELEWIVGEWVDESDEAVVRSSFRWSKNRNFLTNNFRAEVPGVEPLEGTQVIGFDAAKGKIRSWTFNSNGGIAEAVWTKKGNQWFVRSRSVTFDGQLANSTNIFTLKDNNEFSWKSINRTMNAEAQPDIDPINVVRLKENQGE